MEVLKKHPMLSCMGVFAICACARIIEYFAIRTDETFISENVIHKIFGIALLIVILRILNLNWNAIGIKKDKVFRRIGKGLLLGAACFLVAYSAECLILHFMTHDVHLEFYVTGFSLTNDMQKQTGVMFLLLCIAFNLINVFMEEGVFRGLFSSILEAEPFARTCFVIAFLFGIWHLAMPFRDYLDGNSSLINLLIMGVGYVILAGVMSIKWSLLYKLTGNLWMGMGDHLFNNVVVTNLLHVVSMGEADGLQIIRIALGQLISFAVVYLYYKKRNGSLFDEDKEG